MSSEMTGGSADLSAVTDEFGNEDGGVEHGSLLRAFARSVVRDDADLDAARAALVAAAGGAATARAAAVCANFDAITKVADGTGTVLDDLQSSMADDVLEAVGFTNRPD